MSLSVSTEDKELINARQRAVRQAWADEKKAVQEGKGSRDWTEEQQKQILENGRVHNYDGHHMRSVSYGNTRDEQFQIAGDKNNIQFLDTSKENNEHLAAHGGDTHNPTNGYYEVKTGKTYSFGNGRPNAPEKKELSHPISEKENTQVKSNERYDEYGVKIKENQTKNRKTQTNEQKMTHN